MAKGLQRQFSTYGDNEHCVDIWDTTIKKIVFTGNMNDAANFLKVPRSRVASYFLRGLKIDRKYAIRTSKNDIK